MIENQAGGSNSGMMNVVSPMLDVKFGIFDTFGIIKLFFYGNVILGPPF